MESKKLSRTVLKRLRKKGLLLPSSAPTKTLSDESPNSVSTSVKKKKKKCKTKRKGKVEQNAEPVSVVEVKSDVEPTVSPTDAPSGKTTNSTHKHRKHDSKGVVTYINSNYVSNDADEVGGLIHAELVGLRKQSKNIKSASDLTENQAHVIKRQITKLHGTEVERDFKRPKHCEKTLSEATKELARLLKERKAKLTTTSNKSENV